MWKTLPYVLILWGIALSLENSESISNTDSFEDSDNPANGTNNLNGEVVNSDPLIIGGRPISIRRVPYMVSLRYNGYFLCGAALINRNTVLTAAHCVHGRNAPQFSVGIGATNRLEAKSVPVSQIFIHPQYPMNNDVAVIKLAAAVKYNRTVRPIALASSEPEGGTPALVAGWGRTSQNGTAATNLQSLKVRILDRATCKGFYPQLTPQMICIRGVSNKGACYGDSGSPLVVRRKLVGVVSYGTRECAKGYPDVYANVPSLMSFIRSHL